MRYVSAKYEEYHKNLIYRIYVTDCLQYISENSAKVVAGKYQNLRFYEVINPQQFEQEEIDPKEVIDSISKKLDALGRKA